MRRTICVYLINSRNFTHIIINYISKRRRTFMSKYFSNLNIN
nr:MAG TPA: hypothetical protein [Crassvirales sp.]